MASLGGREHNRWMWAFQSPVVASSHAVCYAMRRARKGAEVNRGSPMMSRFKALHVTYKTGLASMS